MASDYESRPLDIGSFAVRIDYAFSSRYWITPGGLLVSTLGPRYKRPTTKSNMLNARISFKKMPMGEAAGEIGVFGKNILNDKSYMYGFDGAASGAGFGHFVIDPLPMDWNLELNINRFSCGIHMRRMSAKE